MKRVIKHRLRSTVIVTLENGAAFRGVLFDYDTEALVLRGVQHLSPGGEPPALVDGELLLLMADVSYIQIP